MRVEADTELVSLGKDEVFTPIKPKEFMPREVHLLGDFRPISSFDQTVEAEDRIHQLYSSSSESDNGHK